jgi:RNA-directed DNA polymerase
METENQDSENWADWEQFIEANFARRFQDWAKTYAAALLNRGFPVIFDAEHLARRMGIPGALIRSIVAKQSEFYRSFSIPKRSGGTRIIRAPFPAPLQAQRWILRHILSRIEPSRWAHGFVTNRSIVTNALEHIAGNSILRMDIADFFPSIKIGRVITIFQNAGYSSGVSYSLASICTLENSLPQGAATSPAIANLIARFLDRRLASLAVRCDLRYSRYADDMIFSGSRISGSLPRLVGRIVKSEGFEVNEKKTLLARNAQKRIVTGIAVSNGKTRLPRDKRRALRASVHRVLAVPPTELDASRRLLDAQYLQRLLGSVAHWKNVEPTSTYASLAHGALLKLRASLILQSTIETKGQ